MTEDKESSGLRVGWFITWLYQVVQIAVVISGPSTFSLSNYQPSIKNGSYYRAGSLL